MNAQRAAQRPNETRLRRRFWVALAVSGALAALAVSRDYVGGHVFSGGWIARLRWVELALATLALLWCGWPLMARSPLHRPGWPRLIGALACVIFGYGVLAVLAPGLWPREWRDAHGMVAMRFEIVSVAIALALLLEWWFARSRAVIGD